MPNVVWTFGAAHLLGVGLALFQYHWCRALGFVPWAWLLLTVAFAGLSSQPDAAWPLALLGFAGIAGTAAWLAKVLFIIFLIAFVASLIFRRSGPHG